VQIPEALRECHWDIDRSGPQPVYCLHRNAGGADLSGGSGEMERLCDLARAKRVERLEAVRRALTMSPEQLREFEKEDLFLAKAMQNPDDRADAALFLALPPDQLQKLVDDGRVQPRYADLSPDLKEGFERLLKRTTNDPNLDLPEPPWPGYEEQEIYAFERERVSRWRAGPDPRVDFVDTLSGFGVGLPDVFLTFPILPKFPTEQSRYESTALLSQHGGLDAWSAADQVVSQWIEKGRARPQEWDSSRQRVDQAPEDPELLRSVRLVSSGRTELAQLQREIAAQTGLSLLSDYFSERPVTVSGSLTQPTPLWRLLNVLSAESGCVWKKAGSYLVFHHIKWSDLAPGEIPESLLTRYRQRLAAAGQLTIADAAEFAVVWEGKDMRAYGIPMDLQEAGLGYSPPELLLYALLTPEQIASARRPPGLPCSELTMPQRKRLAEMIAHEMDGPRMTLEQAISGGHLRIEETVTKLGNGARGETAVCLFVQLGDDRPRYPATFRFLEMGASVK
jgi:hypothetical protein